MFAKKKKILVVDDHKVIVAILTKILEAEGYAVRTAYDGHEAIQAYRAFEPDAVLLDVMMPKENGYRVCRMIKTLSRLAGDPRPAPVILLTARRLDDDPEREEMMNRFTMADAIIYKPFDPRNVIRKIESLLS